MLPAGCGHGQEQGKEVAPHVCDLFSLYIYNV